MSARTLPDDPALCKEVMSEYENLQRRLNRLMMELEKIQIECISQNHQQMEWVIRRSLNDLRYAL